MVDWIRQVIDYSRSRGSARAVLRCLAFHANDIGCADPTVARLSADVGYSERTVQRALRQLEHIGEIKVVAHREGGRGNPRTYALTIGGQA